MNLTRMQMHGGKRKCAFKHVCWSSTIPPPLMQWRNLLGYSRTCVRRRTLKLLYRPRRSGASFSPWRRRWRPCRRRRPWSWLPPGPPPGGMRGEEGRSEHFHFFRERKDTARYQGAEWESVHRRGAQAGAASSAHAPRTHLWLDVPTQLCGCGVIGRELALLLRVAVEAKPPRETKLGTRDD